MLRIGVVRGGKVVQERIVKERSTVTVGSDPSCTFRVEGRQGLLKLFERVGSGYHLNFDGSMSGRVALASGIADLSTLQGRAESTGRGTHRIALTEESRGKVVVGDTTFLFQFVAPPPVAPRPELPVSILNSATHVDWRTTIIAAVSFLLHFSAIGAIYSDWLDPVHDYDVDVSALVETVKSLPPPPPVEEAKPTDQEPTEKADKSQEDEPKAQAKPTTPSKGAMSQAQAAALSNELEQIELGVLASLAGLGPATANVLEAGGLPTEALDQAAASAAGVGAGGIGLSLGGGGGSIRPGEAGGNLSDIGKKGTTGGGGTGKAAAVKGPTGTASVGGAAVSGGQVSNASRVVAAMRAGFRRCYTRALSANPDAQGRINLSITVGPGGEVSGVTANASGNLPPDVIACVQARARASRFDPPQGGMAVIQVPVTFVKQ